MIQRKIDIYGFTLTELLIVVVIMGILISLAIPSYVKTIEKGKAQEAINALRLIQVEEKRFKELFDAASIELLAEKALNENNHYDSDAEYKSALNGMHRRFIYVMRTLQNKLEGA